MSEQHEHPPDPVPPVQDLPDGPWYRTLDDAIHAWAEQKGFHNKVVEVPTIRVYVHSHIGGWNVG
jgi:hypothetical protein